MLLLHWGWKCSWFRVWI